MFELTVTLKGEETKNDRSYTNRETLATFTVPVEPRDGFRIYQAAMSAAVLPTTQVVHQTEEV